MPASPGQRVPLSRHLQGTAETRPSPMLKAVKRNLFLSPALTLERQVDQPGILPERNGRNHRRSRPARVPGRLRLGARRADRAAAPCRAVPSGRRRPGRERSVEPGARPRRRRAGLAGERHGLVLDRPRRRRPRSPLAVPDLPRTRLVRPAHPGCLRPLRRPLATVRQIRAWLHTAAPPLAGIIRMPLLEFLVFTGLGGVIWAGAFVGLGWVFSSQLELAASYAARLGSWVIVLLAVALGAYIAWKYIARQRLLRRIRIARITPAELKTRLDAGEDMMVVDLRHRVDFETEPSIIPGALHLTTEELEARHLEIPRDREIVLYCT